MLEDRGALNPPPPEPPSSSAFLATPTPETHCAEQEQAKAESMRGDLDLSAGLEAEASVPGGGAGLEDGDEREERRRWISEVSFDWLAAIDIDRQTRCWYTFSLQSGGASPHPDI